MVPVLRFPGFEKEWEEKSFGELYEKHNIKNDLSFGVDKIISVANMYYKEDANVGTEEYLRSYNVFRLGDIAYEGNKSANYAYGRFVENTIGDGIVSHVFDVYSPISSNHCLDYWKYAINYERIMRPILEKSTIKSTMMTNLIARDFLRQKTLVPSLSEQQTIADCLSSIDELISAQTQKVMLLKERKQALLQQLFPQNGETTPRLRFPGFSGEWDEKPLSHFLHEHKTKSDGKCEVHSVSVAKGVINQVEYLGRSFAASDTSKYNLVKPNDIIYTKSPTGAFPYGIVKQNKNPYNVIVSPLYAVYTPVTKYLGYILDSYFENPVNTNNYLSSLVQKGAKNTIQISNDTFVSKSMRLPSDENEQKKIAECLMALDDIIVTETNKLEALKAHKKGLMQQLFPQLDK